MQDDLLSNYKPMNPKQDNHGWALEAMEIIVIHTSVWAYTYDIRLAGVRHATSHGTCYHFVAEGCADSRTGRDAHHQPTHLEHERAIRCCSSDLLHQHV